MDATKYGLKRFEELNTSTSTIMIYANLFFNVEKLLNIPVADIDPPLTKKQKNVDKSKLILPYGTIVSVQSETMIIGVNLRKKKKHWCKVCQPTRTEEDGSEKKILTITEEYEKSTFKGQRCILIKYFCSKCQKIYDPKEQKTISHFLNQITIVISLGNEKNPPLNIMIFKNTMKIVGCKSKDDAMEAVLILWQDYISRIPNAWRMVKGANNPRFVFETVMRNVGFKLGFAIERPALNNLMNQEEYSEHVFMSQYETSAHTNVNIKMFSNRPKDFKYECLVIPLDTKRKPFFTYVPEILYKARDDKKKQKNQKIQGKYATFIVFSSSEVILSGRYDQNMKDAYNFFVSTAFENKDLIEEKLDQPDVLAIKKIKKHL